MTDALLPVDSSLGIVEDFFKEPISLSSATKVERMPIDQVDELSGPNSASD